MRRPRIAINAAVLATAIRIQARLETNIGAVIARNNRLRIIAKKLCRALWPPLLVVKIDIVKIDMQFFETIGWTPGSAAAMNRRVTLLRLLDNRPIFQFLRACHMIGSYEHI